MNELRQMTVDGGSVPHPPPKPRAKCPECERLITISQDGRFRNHNIDKHNKLPDVGAEARTMTQKSLAVYYAAEKAFMAEPTTDTAHAYGIAQDRYFQLREEARHANQLGDALLLTEQNETVGR